MVNYHNPHTVARDFMALAYLHHVFTGIFIWEFFTTLDYEWDIVRGRRPYRWSIWIYTLARVATLSAGTLSAMIAEITSYTMTPINCQAWGTFCLIFWNTAFAASSLLIVLRIVAIWNREKIAILIAMLVWVADLALIIYGCIRSRFHWSHNSCILLYPAASIKFPIMSTLVTDVLLLVILLIGLLRLRSELSDAFGMGRLLWKQGLIWLFIAMVFEITPTVFVWLDLNDPLSFMFQPPNTIAMTIAATRMYRSLMDFGSSDILQESVRDTGTGSWR